MRSWIGLAAVLLCPTIGTAQSAAEQPRSPPAAEQLIKAGFTCDGGKKILAVFKNGTQPTVTLTLSDKRQLVLPQAASASGARYANADESVVFWNKGRTAFIEEAGRRTYTGCAQTR